MGTIEKKNIEQNYVDVSQVVSSANFKRLLRVKRRLYRLLSLPEYPEIEQRVISGERTTKIAEELITRDSVKQYYANIQQLKRDIAYLRKNLPALKNAQALFQEYEMITYGRDFNEVKEMIELYKIQKQRVLTEFALESKIGKLIKGFGQEISLASQLIKDIAALKQRATEKYSGPSIADSVKQYNVIYNDLRFLGGVQSVKRVLDALYEVIRLESELNSGEGTNNQLVNNSRDTTFEIEQGGN